MKDRPKTPSQAAVALNDLAVVLQMQVNTHP